jgi:hypothetical protein
VAQSFFLGRLKPQLAAQVLEAALVNVAERRRLGYLGKAGGKPKSDHVQRIPSHASANRLPLAPMAKTRQDLIPKGLHSGEGLPFNNGFVKLLK